MTHPLVNGNELADAAKKLAGWTIYQRFRVFRRKDNLPKLVTASYNWPYQTRLLAEEDGKTSNALVGTPRFTA